MHGYRSKITHEHAIFMIVSLLLVSDPCTAQEDDVTTTARAATTPIRLGETAAEKRIREVLGEPTSLDVIDAPLNEVLRYFEQLHHIEIEMDARALLDQPSEHELLVTCRIEGVPLRTVLNFILSGLDLTYLIDSDVLQITTCEEARARLKTVIYPVFDLLAPIEDDSLDVEDAFDYQQLIELINLNVKSYGEITPIRGYDGSLIISETEKGHWQIFELLQGLRQYQASDSAMSNHEPIRVGETEAESAVRAKLSERTTIDFVDTPLIVVVRYLGDRHDLQIEMNRSAFEDLGIDTSAAVTRKLNDVSLRSALDLILAELDLAFLIEPGMLIVTSKEGYKDQQRTVIYPTTDLTHLTENNRYGHNELSVLIYTFVDPTSWPEGTGPGVIREFCGAMVFTQMEDVHRHTIEFLRGLRTLKSISQ